MIQSANSDRLFFKSGDLFSLDNGFNGIAAFIPCGLTAFRLNCKKFIQNNPPNIVMVVDMNKNNKIYDIAEVRGMVFSALDSLYSNGANFIGMNGICTHERAGLSEQKVAESCLDWLNNHTDSNVKIVLVDLRGGFERYCSGYYVS